MTGGGQGLCLKCVINLPYYKKLRSKKIIKLNILIKCLFDVYWMFKYGKQNN